MHMKLIKILLTVLIIITCSSCSNQKQPEIINEGPKVILDCDMAYFSDDAMALSLLLQAEKQGLVNLMGITIVGGNTFVAEGTNTTLRQLELFERTDVPVYQGEDIPIEGFLNNLKKQNITDAWGAINRTVFYIPPEKWNDLGLIFLDRKYGYASIKPQEKNAVDFLVESVQAYPKEITIFAIGPAINIAKAIEKDPTFAENVKEIIYMDGCAYVNGNITPYAEYNVFYDPKAFDIAIHSNFPSQVLVPNDISHVLSFDYYAYSILKDKPETPLSKAWRENFYDSEFSNPSFKTNTIWDVATVMYFLKPELFTQIETHGFDVNCDRESEKYGQTLLNDNGDIKVLLNIDVEKAWDLYTDMLSLSNNEETGIHYSDYKANLEKEISEKEAQKRLGHHKEIVIDGKPRSNNVKTEYENIGFKDYKINSFTYDILDDGDYLFVLDIDINKKLNYFDVFSPPQTNIWDLSSHKVGNNVFTFIVRPSQFCDDGVDFTILMEISMDERAFIGCHVSK